MNGGVKSNLVGGSFGLQALSLASIKTSQQSVHLTLGILWQSKAVFYALAFFQLDGFAVPAPAQVTQTVRRFPANRDMKTKTLLAVILAIVLVSCTPASISTPTETPVPTSTITSTPVPPTPTTTPTPMPENLADTKDLQIWVEQYVNAYGGKITVNSVEMDASQLTDAIRKNAESYLLAKEINGATYSFLMVNSVPLAIRDENGKWQEATIKKMSSIASVRINITGIYDEKELMKKHFTSYSSFWAFTWNIFRPDSKEKYSFDRTDYDIKLAQEIGTDNVQVFHLVWGWNPIVPDWLKNGKYSESDLITIMQEHIQKTVSRYKGKVVAWSVVNEPFGSGDGNPSFWSDELGNSIEKSTEWIGTAFKVAHENDPNAKLFLNDTGIEFGGDKSDKIFALVKTLKEQGYPIDGIGFQMHLSGYKFLPSSQREQKTQQLASQIQRYRDIGIEVRITELDIAMNGVPSTPQERYGMQFDIYKAIVETALKEGVKEITVFGVKDEQSWLISTYGLKDAEPSLFNNQGIKPAYYAITQALFESIH